MKVVLLAGGLGIRLGHVSENRPKPLVGMGKRPILGHVMAHHAHFGITEFVIALGYKSDETREGASTFAGGPVS